MRRFVTVDVTKATVADGLLTVSSQWLSRAGLTLHVSRDYSFILSDGTEEFYISVSKGEMNFKWFVLRTMPGGAHQPADGDCALNNENAELEMNYAIQAIRAWNGGDLPDEEDDPVPPQTMSVLNK